MQFRSFLVPVCGPIAAMSGKCLGQGMEGGELGSGDFKVEVNVDASRDVAPGCDEYTLHNSSTPNSGSLEYAPSITADGRTF